VMSEALFDKILYDLASVGYDQSLVWSRYHEPLADESIFQRLMKARQQLPKAFLALVSNGDYLNRDNILQLEKAGLNRLMLDLYLPTGKERDESVAAHEVDRFAARTGLSVLRHPGSFDCQVTGSTIDINMGIPNYSVTNISTRGGLVQVPLLSEYQRKSSCFAPLHSVVIDFNGKGMLCCQTRSDAPEHQRAIIGDLSVSDYTLFHFYRDLCTSRMALLSPGPKHGVCKTCTMSDHGPDKLSRNRLVYAISSRIPGVQQAFEFAVRVSKSRRRWER
jgi:hypothetical protein